MLLPGAGCAGTRAMGDPSLRSGQAAPLPPLGLQLYTLRTEMTANLERTLARVGSLGYREVEFAGYFGRTPAQVRAALAAAGLTAPATHLALETLEGERQAGTLAEAAAVGHRWIVVPWIAPAQRRTLDDWRRIAGRLNVAAAAAQRAGFSFAYHNHDFELTPIDARVPLELLLAETDPALVKLELDVYWAVKAGADPFALFSRWPGRVAMLHLKDTAGAPAHRMVEVGAGTIDWARILREGMARGGVRHAFVEHDQPADPWASVWASAEHLKKLAGSG